MLSAFGFSEYEINLSTRPDKFVGDDAIWSTAEAALKEALDAKGWTYSVDEGGEGRRTGAAPAAVGLLTMQKRRWKRQQQ